jgi:hypothetical protein
MESNSKQRHQWATTSVNGQRLRTGRRRRRRKEEEEVSHTENRLEEVKRLVKYLLTLNLR